MNKTRIDWCDSTWNPVVGCLHGCEYCYAKRIAERFMGEVEGKENVKRITAEDGRVMWELIKPIHKANGKISPYPCGFIPTFHRYRLNDYINKKGRNIFVCSMADLFGDWVPDSWINEVFNACKKAPQHNYLFLTKNPGRYVDLINKNKLPYGNNMWFGYSATNKYYEEWWNPDWNIFASAEPLLEPIVMPRCKWLIIGAETGRRKNKVVPERKWIEDLVNECQMNGTPVFMKSRLAPIWGEPLIQEFPDELRRT